MSHGIKVSKFQGLKCVNMNNAHLSLFVFDLDELSNFIGYGGGELTNFGITNFDLIAIAFTVEIGYLSGK